MYYSLEITHTTLQQCKWCDPSPPSLPKLKCLWQSDNLNMIHLLSQSKTVMRVSIFPALWHLQCVPVITLRKQTGSGDQEVNINEVTCVGAGSQSASLTVLKLKVSLSLCGVNTLQWKQVISATGNNMLFFCIYYFLCTVCWYICFSQMLSCLVLYLFN